MMPAMMNHSIVTSPPCATNALPPSGRVGVQVRPRPHRTERGVNPKVRYDHHHHQRSGPQSGQNTEPYQDGRGKLHPSGYVDKEAKPVRVRAGGEVPEQERLLGAVQSDQDREDNPEQ